jgi:hypothetical protein
MKGAADDGALFALAVDHACLIAGTTPSDLALESWRKQLSLLRCNSYGCLNTS